MIQSHVRAKGSADDDGSEMPVFRAAPGTLYVVATPLGNLRDVTLRALDVLRTADVIAAEDTRVTTTLLRHYGIATRPLSLHEHNEAKRAASVVELLRAGKSVALVTDAGTPAVSDPGARLVAAVHAEGIAVVPIPGASAAVAAISAAGLVAERFVFVGFLPSAAKARRELLGSLAPLPLAVVAYEAPHRVVRTVAELASALDGDRAVVIAREITKKFETIARLPLSQAVAWLEGDPNRTRGEFVIVVDAPIETTAPVAFDVDRVLRALALELPPARAARIAAALTGEPRDALYDRVRALRDESDD
jgi:16S rRNA (cytidine1402-2'-O)-methyltransferase